LKLLLDSCVWGGALSELRDAGHDAMWCGEWSTDPGDEAILAFALGENRVLVTLDKDFGELAIIRRRPHAGIVRIVGYSARKQADICNRVLAFYASELAAGGIVTAEPGRVRVRPAE